MRESRYTVTLKGLWERSNTSSEEVKFLRDVCRLTNREPRNSYDSSLYPLQAAVREVHFS